MKPSIRLEGRNPVLEALRKGRASSIMLAEGGQEDSKIELILDLARRQGVPVEVVSGSYLDSISKTGRHQGVIAEARIPETRSLGGLLREAGRSPCVVMLDQVQDPRNLGAILRTCDASGVEAVVIPKRGAADLTATVHRVSMGGSLNVPVFKQSLYTAVKLLREEGLKLVAVDASGETPYYDEDLSGAVTLIMGGEDRGISPTLLDKCDRVASIPMLGLVTSLNVSVATGVVLYERVRQRELKA